MLLELLIILYAALATMCFMALMITWIRGPLVNRAGLLTLATLSLLCICSIVQLLSSDLERTVFLHLARSILTVVSLTSFALFVVQFMARTWKISALRYALVLVAVILMCLMILDPWLHLIYARFQMVLNPMTHSDVLVTTPGPLLIIWAGYSYVLSTAATLLFLRHIWRTQERKVFAFLVGGVATASLMIVPVGSITSPPLVDIMGMVAIFGSLMGALIYITAVRYGILNIAPVAKHDIFNNLGDALAILDREGKLAESNHRFQELAGVAEFDLIGRPIRSVLSKWPALADAASEMADGTKEVSLADGRFLEVSSREFSLTRRQGKGSILQVHDVSERKRMELELSKMAKEVEMLDQLARHDIVNQAVTIRGYAGLMETRLSGQPGSEYLRKVDGAAMKIEQIARFAKEYADMGKREPEWLRLGLLMDQAASGFDLEKVALIAHLDDHEVLADTMIQQVLVTMLDNALRHGETLTRIQVGFELRGDDLLLVFEDDGVGVPEQDKECIFEKGYGKNTGIGLFTSRAILSLNGLGIQEVGSHGKGARFEVEFPAGKHRLLRNDGAS